MLALLDDVAPARLFPFWFSVSLTTVCIPVIVARIVVAATGRRPAPLNVMPWQRRVASLVHATLYLGTAAVLASGVLMVERDIDVFGVFEMPRPLADAGWNRSIARAHRVGCSILALLVIVHVVAAASRRRLSPSSFTNGGGRRVPARMR